MPHQPSLISVVTVLAALAIVVFRNARPRTISVARLWIVPAILVILSAFVVWASVAGPSVATWQSILACAIGVVAGIPLGYARGYHSDVRLGDRPRTMVLHPSLVVMLIWLAAFAVRFGLRAFLPGAGATALALSDGFLLFAVSSVVTANVVIFRKYEALANRAA